MWAVTVYAQQGVCSSPQPKSVSMTIKKRLITAKAGGQKIKLDIVLTRDMKVVVGSSTNYGLLVDFSDGGFTLIGTKANKPFTLSKFPSRTPTTVAWPGIPYNMSGGRPDKRFTKFTVYLQTPMANKGSTLKIKVVVYMNGLFVEEQEVVVSYLV